MAHKVVQTLFASLAVWLCSAGYDWVVCTGTDQLRNSFHRLGIATLILVPELARGRAVGLPLYKGGYSLSECGSVVALKPAR